MLFTVTYREKDGAKVEVEIEAANRSDCFAQCKARGIAPLGVRVGGSGARVASSNRRGLFLTVAILCTAVIGGGAWWWFATHPAGAPYPAPASQKHPSTERPAKQVVAKPPKVVQEDTPTSQPVVPPAAVRATPRGTPIPDNVQPDEFGVLRYPGGLRWVDTNDLHIVKHPRKKQLFKHHSENSIAMILTLDPARMAPFLVGHRPKFGQRFVEDFKASLYDETPPSEDDTEEDREVRKAVMDVKREMAEALKRGEDIAKIMNDAQDELDRLVSYRDTLVKQLKEIRLDEKYTDEDVESFTAAANKMLKSQGMQELRTPNLTYRQTMLQRRRERMNGNSENEGENGKPVNVESQK